MNTTTSNHFANVIDEVESAPKASRPDKVISGIAKQMTQSSNPQIQQLGQELQQVKSQLVSALQQS